MRLLHAKLFTFHEFFSDVPPYAILSHTWGEDEVTLNDILQGKARSKKGFQKIQWCASQALKDGYQYVWVDTCGIDKSSSSELSEAINSMFQWYKNSKVCYVYLVDVQESDVRTIQNKDSQFRKSRWFTRGWTLQELLAPKHVHFYSTDWKSIGAKKEFMITRLLSEITSIPEAYLIGKTLGDVSIAVRMSWASKRVTTRLEDTAYCLLGIFNVNMPLLYGEGDKAFLRLQEEIMKNSEDRSLFTWVTGDFEPSHLWQSVEEWNPEIPVLRTPESALLAPSPACYVLEVPTTIALGAEDGGTTFTEPYFTTNKGLCITLPLFPLDPQSDVYVAAISIAPFGHRYAVLLRCISNAQKRFVRIQTSNMILWNIEGPLSFRPQTIYVAPGKSSHYRKPVTLVMIECRWKQPILTAERKQVYTSDVTHWAYPNSKLPQDDLPMNPGESCVVVYALPRFKIRFLVIIRCTRAGRCIVGIEPDNINTPEQLLTKWKKAGWADLRPSVLNTLALEEYLSLPDQYLRVKITGFPVKIDSEKGTAYIRYCLELSHATKNGDPGMKLPDRPK
jgi:hypothetical protein